MAHILAAERLAAEFAENYAIDGLEAGVQEILTEEVLAARIAALDTPAFRAKAVASGLAAAGLQAAVKPGKPARHKTTVKKKSGKSIQKKKMSRPHRSFSLYRSPPKIPGYYQMPTVRRGRRTYRTSPIYGRTSVRKARSTPLKFSTSAKNRVSKGSTSAIGRQIVVKKLGLAPNPTSTNAGGSINFLIQNASLKTTPDGQGSFGYAFKLSQFPQYSEYTALYQWYKILSVRLTFYPEQNAFGSTDVTSAGTGAADFSGAGGKASHAPIIVIAPDQTSDATFTNINSSMSHHDSRFHSFNDGKELSIYLAPKPNSLIGNAGGEVTTLSSSNKWITTDSAEVEHYGLRCFVDRFTDSASLYTVMEMKVAFKEPKT